jgi:hypothetical protein
MIIFNKKNAPKGKKLVKLAIYYTEENVEQETPK